MSDRVRVCGQCGHQLAAGAVFCRSCGARYEEPAPPAQASPSPPAQGRRRISGALLFLVFAVVVTAAGLAVVLLLDRDDSSSTVTVAVSKEASTAEEGTASEPAVVEGPAVVVPASSPGSIEPGRYVQAGTFKFIADAESERERLAADGIRVDVVRSEEAQELYPGFQVLLGGPVRSAAAENSLLRKLRHSGVPSAFARPLTPAQGASPSELGGGTWTGELEESSTTKPILDRGLPVTFVVSADGQEGRLTFADPRCVAELEAEPSTGPSLRFGRSSGCFAGTWRVRPTEDGLMLSLLPADSDVIVIGELRSD
jgi:hypothetical protein